jgi:hypothetical protein
MLCYAITPPSGVVNKSVYFHNPPTRPLHSIWKHFILQLTHVIRPKFTYVLRDIAQKRVP